MVDVRVGWARFDVAAALDTRIGWAQFDAGAEPFAVQVGWAEFDVGATPFSVAVGWAELDTRASSEKPVPEYHPGDGIARYHVASRHEYDIPVDVEPDEEEELIYAILTELAHVV